jgi:hypothetical protein
MSTSKDISERLNEYHQSMITTLETLKADDLQSGEVSIRLGNKLYHLVVAKDEPLLIEDQIRKEFQEKITVKLSRIGETIKGKMSEVSSMVSAFKEEFERKEHMMKETLARSAPMPEVMWEHAQKGLSIVKGSSRGEILWFVKRLYSPKLIDRDVIEPLYIKKLTTNIYILIKTIDKQVSGVSTRYINSLDFFEHYHQAKPDCWGQWRYPTKWDTPDDIIKIADDAIGVLGAINTMSIANRSPRLMPKLETLRRHVIKNTVDTLKKDIKLNIAEARETFRPVVGPMDDNWSN